jgi:hypothetical protein
MQQTATSYLVLDDDHWNLGEIRRSGKPSQTPSCLHKVSPEIPKFGVSGTIVQNSGKAKKYSCTQKNQTFRTFFKIGIE